MLRYLKEAFLVRARVPLLGGVPVNVLAAVGFGILGFAPNCHWLWPLGAALVGGFTLLLATTPRFQKVVDSRDIVAADWQTKAIEKTLISQLPGGSKQRLERLDARCARVLATHREAGTEPLLVDSTADALAKLRWLYIKLLVAQANLEAADREAGEVEIKREIASVERDLGSERVSAGFRQSREATLEILNKRLENLWRREQSLREIDGDLKRIDAQVELAVEEATLRSQPQALSGNIELASQLLDSGVYGESGRMVMDLDERIGQKG